MESLSIVNSQFEKKDVGNEKNHARFPVSRKPIPIHSSAKKKTNCTGRKTGELIMELLLMDLTHLILLKRPNF